MKAPNHITGGLLFTGIFASLSGINIFATPLAIATTVVASLLPDIDHPKSIVGRLFKPLSKWLNRHYGHRTITHSAVVLLLGTLVFALIEKTAAGQTQLATIFCYAYLSHLLFDMMTLQGVPLFYPFFKNPFVLPANPAYRIRTDDIRAETVVFCLFLLLSFTLRPLFQNGFWTSYNRLFGTLKHLSAEFSRSDDLLEVAYTARKGSESIQGKGYCIEATPTKVVLVENNAFVILDKKELHIEKVIPTHTGLKFYFETTAFNNISIDSLNNLITPINLINNINLNANQKIQIIHNHQITETKTFKTEYLHQFQVCEPGNLSPLEGSRRGTFLYKPNPRIPILETKLQQLQTKNQTLTQHWQEHLRQLNQLKSQINLESNLSHKEYLYQQYQEAMKIKAPTINLEQETLLATEIQQLRQQEHITNLQKQLNSQATNAPPIHIQISGQITFLKILNPEDKDTVTDTFLN
jgi:inner membrane protein